MTQPALDLGDDPRLEAALAEYFDRIDTGKPFDREAFLQQHAAVAPVLVEFWKVSERVEQMAGPSAGDAERQQVTHDGSLDSSVPGGDAATSLAGMPRKFNRYLIEKKLGQGGMGMVFLARDTALDRQVALKIPNADAKGREQLLQRFQREARSAATVRHPNICPVYDVGESEGLMFISMAYIPGRPLADYLRGERQLPQRQAVNLIRKLALALQAAHAHGIVHRDLKPNNIIIDVNGEPIITDFGLARQLNLDADAAVTREGQLVGSPAYMSPEQIESRGEIGPASDVFSLGVIFYEMLAGRRPFQGSMANVFAQIVVGAVEPPSRRRAGLDLRLEEICLKMLQPDRAARYATMEAVAADLTVWLRDALRAQMRPAEERGIISPAASSPETSAATCDGSLALQELPTRAGRRETTSRKKPNRTSQSKLRIIVAAAAMILMLSTGGAIGVWHAWSTWSRSTQDALPAVANEVASPADLKESTVEIPAISPVLEHLADAQSPLEGENPDGAARPAEKQEPPTEERPVAASEPAADEGGKPSSPVEGGAGLLQNVILEQVKQIQALVTQKKNAGEFGRPPAPQKMNDFAHAEVDRRKNDGRLPKHIELTFQFTANGMTFKVSGKTGGAPPGGGTKGGGLGGGFGGGGTAGGGRGGGKTGSR